MVHIRLDEIDSTNDYAIQLASKSKPEEGTVISAAFQHAGKGQYGRTWSAEKGENATFSIIFYPDWLPLNHIFMLNLSFSLACLEGLRALTGLDGLCLKWPNDIYIGHSKIGGMLLRNTIKGQRFESSIIGFGINVNQRVFVPHLKRASSLSIHGGQSYDIDNLIEGLHPFMLKYYQRLKNARDLQVLFLEWKEEYLKNLFLYQKEHEFYVPEGHALNGTIMDVQMDGKIVLQLSDNDQLRAFELNKLKFFQEDSIKTS